MSETELKSTATQAELNMSSRLEGCLSVAVKGDWLLRSQLPNFDLFQKELDKGAYNRVQLVSPNLGNWDSGLIIFLQKVAEYCKKKDIELDAQELVKGVRSILALSLAVPEKEGTESRNVERSLFYKVGSRSIRMADAAWETFTFIGESCIALAKFFTGRARFRWVDLLYIVQQCGAEALPIVALISFLIGLIMAFVGAIQLQQFGADIYVANLVGLAMVREMGAMMTAIIMCGRTGAAFAAQLGTMKVNEEIDALNTMGISPMEFLVLPRMIALFLMMPLLVLFSNFVGIIGGLCVSLSMLDITFNQYINQTVDAIDMVNFSTGIVKSVAFGGIVAGSGCLRGMQCGNSSAAVGIAATSAVVTGITLLIVSDAIFAVIFSVLGI